MDKLKFMQTITFMTDCGYLDGYVANTETARSNLDFMVWCDPEVMWKDLAMSLPGDASRDIERKRLVTRYADACYGNSFIPHAE